MYWKKADKLLTFKEIKGTCFGYSNKGISGNAIGKELRKNILETIKELQKSGEVDPVIFELLNVFQEKVGCDRVSDYPLELIQPHSIEELQKVVDRICQQLKKLVEDNGLWRLLYDENVPKHESAAQLLFFGIADAYCIANNIDLSREVHNGHDPVGFLLCACYNIGTKKVYH